MFRITKSLLVMASLAFVAAPHAATAADPVFGTWKLNVAQSKFSPGPALKSQTRTYKDSAGSVAMSFSQVSADGKESAGASTFKYDGKEYPITGSPDYDTLVLKAVNDHTIESSQKRAGKVVGTSTRTVAKDGKTMTLVSKGTSATGVAFDNTLVFDRE